LSMPCKNMFLTDKCECGGTHCKPYTGYKIQEIPNRKEPKITSKLVSYCYKCGKERVYQ
jgi:hypothetical protein